ncbi:hypothetical protein Poly51_59110 [Rubripirellula tenax]|uniref:DUF3592 domain-containing protein n=1 Tax=Rubripirellula tenax TaxID=2528015 RepID=A0A5C6E6S6_9BACT|nr:DUF3592 domain-containing protein [Rubripirellula tenax]TWU44642.1 hypothetical protein Poly51_59110 [Rubripirellula tenax]
MLRLIVIAGTFLIAAIILATAIPAFFNAAWLAAFGTETTGTVISHQARAGGSTKRTPMLYPVVEFSYLGETVRFTEEKGQEGKAGRLAGNVPVYFNADNPATASVSTFIYLWYDPLVRILISSLFFGMGAWMLRSSRSATETSRHVRGSPGTPPTSHP